MNTLSVVCIGRNESNNILKLINSLEILRNNNFFSLETIYVDSASTDESVKNASVYFDTVIELEHSEWLCAAAGRWAGTNHSKGDLILYLDADMELCQEFVSTIENAFSLKDSVNTSIDGWIGRYIHTFADNSIKKMGFSSKEGPADAIGGSILVRRNSVLRAGNWLPFIFSMEEMELYSRLKDGNKSIKFVDVDMIRHHTEKHSKLRLIHSMLLPSGGYGKKFYGMGQIIHHRIKKNSIYSFAKLLPDPFIFFTFEILLLTSLVLTKLSLSILISALYFTWSIIIKRNKLSTILSYTSYSIQIVYGWPKYNPNFIPTTRNIINKYR